MTYYLGIEAVEPAYSVAALADERGVIQQAFRYPHPTDPSFLNFNENTWTETATNLYKLVWELAGQMGITVDDLARECRCVCSGLRGVRTPDEAGEALPGIWSRIGFSKADILGADDADIMLAASGRTAHGGVLVSHVGSTAFARAHSGKTSRVGGWGWQIGDEGSGHWIGKRALEVASTREDHRLAAGEGAPSLRHLILESLSRNQFTEGLISTRSPLTALVELCQGNDIVRKYWRYILSDLVRPVFLAAEHGDAMARDILDEAAEELSLQLFAALKQAGLLDNRDGKAAFCGWGDVLCGEVNLWEQVQSSLDRRLKEHEYAGIALEKVGHRPVLGALLHALAGALDRLPGDRAVIQQVISSARAYEGPDGPLSSV